MTKELSPTEKKTLAEFEQEQGVIMLGDKVDLKKKMTRQEFWDLINFQGPENQNHLAIDWAFRTKWLEDNGYEVTRANLANGSLAPKQ